jgi:hypothetical protein
MDGTICLQYTAHTTPSDNQLVFPTTRLKGLRDENTLRVRLPATADDDDDYSNAGPRFKLET